MASRLEGHIEAEYSFFFSNIFFIMDDYLSTLRGDVNNGLVMAFEFVAGEGSASDCDFDALFFCHLTIII